MSARLAPHTKRSVRRARAVRQAPLAKTMNAAPSEQGSVRPMLILTISNGAGHTRAAQAIAGALRAANAGALVVDVADYMNAVARFTHVTAYLWLVKHAPRAWERIDLYQRRQPHTSPEWFYRHSCRRLFEYARSVQPSALVATEVGCCEIAALIKRDLKLDVPLVAVNINYDADRAWVQPEVDLYTMMTNEFRRGLVEHGAPQESIAVWGAPLTLGFEAREATKASAREEICRRFDLNTARPIVLIAGGGEGLGRIEDVVRHLLALKERAPQLLVLTGHNKKLQARCESLAHGASATNVVRISGWLDNPPMPVVMRACDLMVSKLGNAFDEAIAVELPIVALPPPPGAEQAQYELLKQWKTGCAVSTLTELTETVAHLLANPTELEAMRERTRKHNQCNASQRIANWLLSKTTTESLSFPVSSERGSDV